MAGVVTAKGVEVREKGFAIKLDSGSFFCAFFVRTLLHSMVYFFDYTKANKRT